MLPKILRTFWGDLSTEELKKFGILAITFFIIIGTYWMMRTMKNPIFSNFIGMRWQPFAKWASLIFVGFAVLFYSKMVDLFEKHNLFYVICSFYGLGFILLAFFMAHPDLVTLNPISTAGKLVAWIPGKGIGWFGYLFLESFGSIVPALFWAFVASSTTTESAKRGYGMIVSLTQFGTILGPLAVAEYSSTLGLPVLFGIGGLLILIVPLMIKIYTVFVPSESVNSGQQSQEPQTGFLEGLRLLLTKSYLLGILAVATLYEIVGTILEYQKDVLAEKMYPPTLDGGAGFAWFEGVYGVSVGILALLFATVGTSFFLRRFGLRFCLVTFPSIIGVIMCSIFLANFWGTSLYQLMWFSFVGMVIIKGLNYALNNPTKEVLYIPTSRDVKFKAKGWIDAFGGRASKAMGSGVTAPLGASVPTLLLFGTAISLGIVGFWIIVAMAVGNAFNKLQEEKRIIK